MAFDTFLFLEGFAGESNVKFAAGPQGLPGPPSEIFSFSFGATNPTTVGSGSGGLTGGKVSLSGLHVMKKSEDMSAKLFANCTVGEHIGKASLVLRKASGKDGKQQIFLSYDLEGVMVESIQWSGSTGGDDTPSESISFAFAKITIQYYQQDVKGQLKKGSGAMWDVTTVSDS